MKIFPKLLILIALAGTLAASRSVKKDDVQRPLDVWAIRSVLDLKPRMLTVALDEQMYVAYDMAAGTLYKVWKGGIFMNGAPYTSKKEVQPVSWGTEYLSDSTQHFAWTVRRAGRPEAVKVQSKGYFFKDNQIYLQSLFILNSGDTIRVEERPEFVVGKDGRPGLERIFVTSRVPEDVTITLKATLGNLKLVSNGRSRHIDYFEPLPEQTFSAPQKKYAHKGEELVENSDCLTCHERYEDNVGPSFQNIAGRYPKNEKTTAQLNAKIKNGGTGAWGSGVMNPHPNLEKEEIDSILDYIFTLKPKERTPRPSLEKGVTNTAASLPTKPGFGASLDGVHPSFDLSTLHNLGFRPKVGALAFLPDGRLLVTTWDVVGGVYLLDGVTGDGTNVRVKRIASGLAEPLGIEVVNGEIYVLQKQELTKLIDHDGDEIIDEYQTVCNRWGVTADFHEFAFGLVHKDGYFYATLSMAMRLKPDEKQLPDRGRTIKISPDGTFESLNYGLRTPNGIGVGVDAELFVLDNQGQWLPGNKLIHVRKGEFNGMGWGWLDESEPMPRMVPPAVWLPEDEIGNSPSEPVLIRKGTFKGQMLHGDVTHGGIVRDFLEKINGRYQGAAFRFSQGFAAGINRMRWGPDGSLYVGEVGMEGGGWSWQNKTSGLQKLTPNGKSTFEMLAVRARPKGFEIEFTEPVAKGSLPELRKMLVQQWWYEPTPSYGGPKKDLMDMEIGKMDLSDDGRRLYLEIPNLRKENVVYFRLPMDLKSAAGQPLWSSEAWYTLNEIPN